MGNIRRGLNNIFDRPRPKEKPTQLEGKYSEGVTYSFPSDMDKVELRKRIGFARVPGVTAFNCGNCSANKAGFCTRFHFRVRKSDCCSAWTG